MPASHQAPGAVDNSGQGRSGYCVLCAMRDLPLRDEFDKRAALYTGTKNTYSGRKLQGWLNDRGFKGPAPNTINKHREHVRNPADRFVTAVQKRQENLPARQSSHEEFLQSIVSIGAERIAEHPEDVTIDQALKAANIQVQRDKKGQTVNVLVQLMTEGGGDVIEGEVQEL